jgi:hypothetical protein
VTTANWWNDTDKEIWNAWTKTYANATLSTINRTWTGLGSNLGLFGDRLVTKILSHDMVINVYLLVHLTMPYQLHI